MTTAAIIILGAIDLALVVAVLRLSAAQRRSAAIALRHAALATQMLRRFREHRDAMSAQGEINQAVLELLRRSDDGQKSAPHKPNLRLVPRDEDATA